MHISAYHPLWLNNEHFRLIRSRLVCAAWSMPERTSQSDKKPLNARLGKVVKSISSGDSRTGFSEEVLLKPFKAAGNEDEKCKVASYQYQLLQLRAALNDKELQLGELRSQYSTLIDNSADARKNWETSIETKELAIQHLRGALEDRDHALRRQKRLLEGTEQRLVFQRESEKAQVERKNLEISTLKAKSIHQAATLEEQQKLVVELNDQHKKRENQIHAYTKHVKRKVDNLHMQLQNLELLLKRKEEELEAREQCCNDLKVLVWKKDCVVEQLKLSEGQLQSSLERKNLAYKALELANQKLQENNFQMAKSLDELKRELQACQDALLHDSRMKEDMEFQASCLQAQRHQLQDLELGLKQKESSLSSKYLELEAARKDNKMLIGEFNHLKEEYESLHQEHIELHIKLMKLEEKTSSDQKYLKGNSLSQPTDLDNDTVQQQWPTRGRTTKGKREKPSFSFKGLHAVLPTQNEDIANRISRMKEPDFDNKSLKAPFCPSRTKCEKSSEISCADENRSKEGTFVPTITKKLYNEQSQTLGPKRGVDAEPDVISRNLHPSASCHLSQQAKISFSVSDENNQYDWGLQAQGTALKDDIEAKYQGKDRADDRQSNASFELQKIQEEIQKRERSWRQTEANMRAELSRRINQLNEAEIELQPFASKETLAKGTTRLRRDPLQR